jgi:hypothetical protein
MGISCASEVFTEEIRKLLLNLDNCLNMTDDILIYGKTRREHHYSLLKVLSWLELSGLTPNKAKCKFYQKEVVFSAWSSARRASGPQRTDAELCGMPARLRMWRTWEVFGFVQLAVHQRPMQAEWAAVEAPEIGWGMAMDGTEFEEKAFNQVKKSISEKAMAYFNKDWGFTSAFPPPSEIYIKSYFIRFVSARGFQIYMWNYALTHITEVMGVQSSINIRGDPYRFFEMFFHI